MFDSATLPQPLRWMKPEQVAAYLQVSPRTLERMRREGTGPRFERLGHRTIRYNVDQVDRWVQRGGER